MKKKERNKIINALMAFYQLICVLYDKLEEIPDINIRAMAFQEHVFQLMLYHKEFTDLYKIKIPKIDSSYTDYCKNFTKKIMNMEKNITEMVLGINKKDDNIGYII